jgi:flagellar motor protein MotB
MAKKGHGHHGGAWKVAYADFVTAMMALFLVLWLVSQDQKIKEAVERSFRNPFASLTKQSTGIIPAEKETMTVMARSGISIPPPRSNSTCCARSPRT